jgi:hypothetical protein
VERVASMSDAVSAMAMLATGSGDALRVAIGTADCAAAPLSDALIRSVRDAANVVDVVAYRIGPSVSAQRGPGTVECFMFPTSP